MKLRFISLFIIFLVVSLPIAFAGSYTYDANGNLVTDGVEYREYNSFNQLVRVRDSNATGQVLEEYSWHPLEDRVAIKHVYVNGTWKESVYYITENFVQIKNGTGTFNHTYVKQNGQLVAQLNPDGTKYFDHSDHLGSVSLITNESGAIVEETIYSPFGEILEGGETSLYDYEGKEFSSVTGDYDFNARRYDPALGLFLQPDPIIQNIYDPQTLNHYAFERNNPYGHVDPTGKALPLLAVIGIGMAVGAIVSIAYQYATTGEVNWRRVGTAALIGGGISIIGGLLGVGAGIAGALGGGIAIEVGVEVGLSVATSLVGEVLADEEDDQNENTIDPEIKPRPDDQEYVQNPPKNLLKQTSEQPSSGGGGGSSSGKQVCNSHPSYHCTKNGRSCTYKIITVCRF